MAQIPARRRDLLAALLLLLLPAVLLADCLFGGRAFLPFDLAEFPPIGPTLPADVRAALREGANYDATEANVWFVPELTLARQAFAAGRYPHWNPYVRGGAPLAAHGHLGLLDPLHWPALLFADPAVGLLYLTYAMFALAGLLMYGLLRELALLPLPALFGAVAFAFSGTLTANGHWYMRMEPLALLPGMLWALLRLQRAQGRRRGLPAVGLAAAVGCCWLAGFPPFAIPVSLLAGLFGLLLAGQRWRADGRRAALELLLWIAAAFALGLLLAGAQFLQQWSFFPESNRPPAPTLASQSRFAFDPMGLLGYLLPDAFSHPSDRMVPASRSPLAFLLFSRLEWGTGALLRPDKNYNFTEYALFPGTLPLLFAAVGLCARGPRWRILCAGALALSFLLASGCGPFRFAFALPGIQAVPPYRFAGPACAFVAILAALGVQRLRSAGSPWLLRTLCAVCLCGSGYCFVTARGLGADAGATEARWLEAITEHYRPLAPQFDPNLKPVQVTPALVRDVLFTAVDDAGARVDRLQRQRERLQQNLDRASAALLLGGILSLLLSLRRARAMPLWVAVPALLLTGAELWHYGHQLDRGRERRGEPDSSVHQYLREQRAQSDEAGGFMVARANPGGGDPWHLPPGTLAKDRIRDLDFYTFVDGRSGEPIRRLYGDEFMLRDYLPQALPDDERLLLPWWDVMGLRYLCSTRPMQFAGVRVGPPLPGANDAFFVYQRTTALPRAWVVPEIRPVVDDAAAIDAVLARDLQPRDYVVMTTADIAAAHLPVIERNPAAKARRVQFAQEDEQHLELTVSAGARGYLVLADTCMSGWSVEIDKQPALLARGNVYQRVVPLPDHECSVVFSYCTPGLHAGLALTAAALLACGALLLLALRRDGAPAPRDVVEVQGEA